MSVEVGTMSPAAEVAAVGSTVLRGAWPPEKLAVIRQAIIAFTEQRAARVAGGSLEKNERMYAAHGVGNYTQLLAARLIAPGFLRDLFEGSPYHALCRDYFQDETFYADVRRLGFRSHDPNISNRSFIPYHQDSYTQDLRTPSVLNCWIPLDPGAGVDAPGLEVVRNRCRPDFPRKDFGLRSENAAYDFITIEREAIVAEYGDAFLAPQFELGDGLVFSEDVIHRTYVTPEMTRARVNFELRIFSPRHLRPGAEISTLAPFAERLA